MSDAANDAYARVAATSARCSAKPLPFTPAMPDAAATTTLFSVASIRHRIMRRCRHVAADSMRSASPPLFQVMTPPFVECRHALSHEVTDTSGSPGQQMPPAAIVTAPARCRYRQYASGTLLMQRTTRTLIAPASLR